MQDPWPRLTIGRQSAGFVARGHPWIRPDRFTKGLEGLRSGQPVTLVDERGKGLASALADPEAPICARVFHKLPDKDFLPAAAIQRAWAMREALHQDPSTDAYRVVHGEADHLPGLRVERYGQTLVVQLRADCLHPYLGTITASLQDLLPDARVIVHHHLRDLRQEQVRITDMHGQDLDADTTVTCHELGVRMLARPCDGLATGLYVDQRATRQWLRERCAGRRVLNLFAYTGLFSLSLLQAGAAKALDVDLSGPALALGHRNAQANGLEDRYEQVQGDCLSYLREARTEASFDLIIIDPPTAAPRGRQSGWLLRRDYPRLAAAAWSRLTPGGMLVACCNTLGGKPFRLKSLLEDCPGAESVSGPALGVDLPQRRGFPEGRPYQLLIARKAG